MSEADPKITTPERCGFGYVIQSLAPTAPLASVSVSVSDSASVSTQFTR